ncbi:MAG: D-alanine--D-alanine ligase family protein, partial [Oscillospiraceae bacterium]
PALLSPDRATHGVMALEPRGLRTIRIDLIFPAVHGQNCEDGALQGLMELSGIPYVGCGVCASAVGFDKAITHIVAERWGIPMARWCEVCAEEPAEAAADRVERRFGGYPVFVKPVNSGSSVGTGRADDRAGLLSALSRAFVHDRRVLVEELVIAHEVECAVLGNLAPDAPVTGEIVAPGGFYDYNSKYKNDSARLYIPANIPVAAQDEVRRLAVAIYRALDCRGMARVDFFVREDGGVLFNEINTLPGFTSISMYPKMMTAAGMSYGALLTRLLELAQEERGRRRAGGRPE